LINTAPSLIYYLLGRLSPALPVVSTIRHPDDLQYWILEINRNINQETGNGFSCLLSPDYGSAVPNTTFTFIFLPLGKVTQPALASKRCQALPLISTFLMMTSGFSTILT
jgi:hypothetical protein